MITVGIDVGSITTKGAILDGDRLMGVSLRNTGFQAGRTGLALYEALLSENGVSSSDIQGVIATGYGRKNIQFADRSVTEITCHGFGGHFLDPEVRTIIDIGGQDSKVIALDDSGKVTDFVMNDKCAAGTGRFIEVMAGALEVSLDRFGRLSLSADQPATISSLCTVFAESEVISLIAQGETRENIVAGIHEAIARRVAAMATRVGMQPPVMMTGGVAKNAGVVNALEKRIGQPILVLPQAQVTGAIGAAIIAQKS
jgi:predicted CoA-substrate-specific enzyme activase